MRAFIIEAERNREVDMMKSSSHYMRVGARLLPQDNKRYP